MFVFVEYYNNFNVIETDKSIAQYKKDNQKFGILAYGRTQAQIIYDIKAIYRREKYSKNKSIFIRNYLDEYPEYEL